MQNTIQTSNVTKYDRYPGLYKGVKRLSQAIHGDGGRQLRILVFGCSTGEETLTLATRYFTSSNHHIIGVDISESAIHTAMVENSCERVVYHGPDYSLESIGPFDIIFANSVLCRWPASRGLEDISRLYSFESFDRILCSLDKALNKAGLMCILNSNYRFSDSTISPGYAKVQLPSVKHSGFVDKFDRTGKRIDEQYPFACFLKF
jgi:SAM-dependent methyltransferase